MRSLHAFLLLVILLAAGPATGARGDMSGTWAGKLVHEGDSTLIALEFEPAGGDTLLLRLSLPVIHLDRAPLGRYVPAAQGDSLRCGPFRFARSADGSRLHGIVPSGLIPVYAIPFTLARAVRFEAPARAPLEAPLRQPVWTFDAGAPVWAGTRCVDGTVYAGTTAGAVHALDAATGERRWTFTAGGAVRVRPAVAGGAVYVQADDGVLYRIHARDGKEAWRRRIVESPIERLPFSDPRSRYDRFGADVLVDRGTLYVGTHDGRMLALDARTGDERWSFRAGDAILAAPALGDSVLIFGSYDGRVHALDPATGRPLWSHDARAPVVSTPALEGGAAIVGTRGYDLLALDVRSGAPLWKRYIWMSWIESSASLADGVAFVGSSDAAALFAYRTRDGRRLWKTDVHGWSWGQPAVAGARVYAGTAGQVGYPAAHGGGVLALDAASGTVVWRFAAEAPESGAFGFPGSLSSGEGRVFAAGLDGRVCAFEE